MTGSRMDAGSTFGVVDGLGGDSGAHGCYAI